jgi:diguanylate cyclase (GGDEF)-like protein
MAGRSGKILVVDDDPIVRELVSESLKAQGLDVISASQGEEGLNLAMQERPDLVLLDVRMPGMDGFEVCRQLRRGFRTCTIPIIMLTSLTQTADKVEGMLVGADDYVTKPFDPRELIARVTTRLDRSERDIQTSPLTRLPGNLAVERSINDRIGASVPFAVCYFDLDNFKPYNGRYGFVAGDVVIKMLSDVIVKAVLEHGNSDDFVGHEGGDDFVVVTTPDKAQTICEAVISRFDEMVPAQYSEEDRAQGYFLGRDRQGNEVAFPLMSVSGAIVTNESKELVHPRQVAQIAAEVLSHVKGFEGSNCLLDRRRSHG